jgi:hypothetical protein
MAGAKSNSMTRRAEYSGARLTALAETTKSKNALLVTVMLDTTKIPLNLQTPRHD